VTALDGLRRAMTRDLTKLDKVLLLLGSAGQVERGISDLKQTAGDIGMPEVRKWNISYYLSHSNGMAIKSGQGWSGSGRESSL
jgi:hypothetical protein